MKLRKGRTVVVSLLICLELASTILIAYAEDPQSSSSRQNSLNDELEPPPLQIPSFKLPQKRQEPSFIQKIAGFFGFDYARRDPLVHTQSPPQSKIVNTQRSATVSDTQTNLPYNSYTVPQYSNNNGYNYNNNNGYNSGNNNGYRYGNSNGYNNGYNNGNNNENNNNLKIVNGPQFPSQDYQYEIPTHGPPLPQGQFHPSPQFQPYQQPILQQASPPPPTHPPLQRQEAGSFDYFPCNKRPWIPMYNGREIVTNARPEKVQDTYLPVQQNNGPYNYYPAPLPLKSQQQSFKIGSDANSWSQQVSSNLIVGNAPQYTTPNSYNKPVTSREYLPPSGHLPIQYNQPQSQSLLAPIPVPNVSVTQLPPLYNYRPFADFVNGGLAPGPASSKPNSNIIVGTNVVHPSAPVVKNNLNLKVVSSNGGYNYPKPNIIPDLSGGKDHPKTQVETLPSVGQQINSYQQQQKDIHNDFEIIKSIPLVQFTSTMEYHNKNQQNQGRAPAQKTLSAQPIVVANQVKDDVTDSYTAASSHNITVRQEGDNDVGNLGENQGVTNRPSVYDFQPSLQTASTPSPIRIGPNEISAIKKDRDTPKNLLDSPIFYLKGSSPKPFARDNAEVKIPLRHDYKPNTPATLPDWTRSSPFKENKIPLTTVKYSNSDANGAFAGIDPPPMPLALDSINVITKRPKQIQIIIPYTTNNKPHPFKAIDDTQMKGEIKVNDDNYAKWSDSKNDPENYDEEESKIVSATETNVPQKTTKYLTKILASSIRDLLKNEREITKNPKIPFDLVTLQKNIDDWTEQEYSVEPHKASTISLVVKTKTIPDDYLTTTPSMRDLLLKTTTEMPSDHDTTTIADYDMIQNDQDVASNKIVQFDDNYLDVTDDYKASVEQIPREPSSEETEYWSKLKVAISPLTQEKVYVVTPQPPWNQQQIVFNNDEQAEESKSNPKFKSPRFAVRPTPGLQRGSTSYILGLTLSQSVNTLQGQEKPKPFKPELFGRLDHSDFRFDSSDVDELEAFHKKITIVTATPIGKKYESRVDRSKS